MSTPAIGGSHIYVDFLIFDPLWESASDLPVKSGVHVVR